MKILMIAPEPFFQPRGTPISEYYRIKCLTDLGHTVDLVTYPIGDDVEIPGLRIIRAPRIPGISKVKIGPSAAKIPLDISLFFKAWQVLASNEYDAIHSHEEAGIMAVLFGRLYNLPHVYDMHSSLPDQLRTFRFTENRVIHWAFNWMESLVLDTADDVIAICPALVDKALETEPGARVTLIENVAESHDVAHVPEEKINQLRDELDLHGKKVVLYIGTFETYQGLGMLMEAFALAAESRPDTVLLMVGGREEQVAETKAGAEKLGITRQCRFTGTVPHDQVPSFLKVSDILTSPRRYGENTPLKLYSYIKSGVPIVATNLYTNTQVLNENVAELTEPTPEGLAGGIARILDDPEHGKRLAQAAIKLSEEEYSYQRYEDRTAAIMNHIEKVRNGR